MDATPNEGVPQPLLGGELQRGEASHISCSLQRQDARRGHEKKSQGVGRAQLLAQFDPCLELVLGCLVASIVLNARRSVLGAQCSRSDVGLGVLAHLADFPCESHAKSIEGIQTFMTWKEGYAT